MQHSGGDAQVRLNGQWDDSRVVLHVPEQFIGDASFMRTFDDDDALTRARREHFGKLREFLDGPSLCGAEDGSAAAGMDCDERLTDAGASQKVVGCGKILGVQFESRRFGCVWLDSERAEQV